MRPLLGLENYRYKGAVAEAIADGEAEADGLVTVTSSNPATAGLLKALQGINGRGEEEEEDAAMDAICKAPGGACTIPPKKSQRTAAAAASSSAAAELAASGATPAADPPAANLQ
jgi:hypothetical protein